MIKFKVDTYSQGVRVRVVYPNDRLPILEFCKTLTLWDQSFDVRSKRMVTKTKAVFATANMYRDEFGFLRDEFPSLMAHLKEAGYVDADFAFTHHEPIVGDSVEIGLKEGVAPRNEGQEAAVEFIHQPDTRNRILNLPTGFGKAQPLDAWIKIPGSWTTMGEVKVGQTIMGWDGKPCKVTGVYPQGVRPVYRLTFKDGRTVKADEKHLWKVYNSRYRGFPKDGTQIDPWSVTTTAELIEMMKDSKNSFSVPVMVPDKKEVDVDLPIDPYLLGVLLGDGCFRQSSVTITKGDQFIFDTIEPMVRSIKHKLTIVCENESTKTLRIVNDGNDCYFYKMLNDIGVGKTLSANKHIPDVYLNASFNQRLSLLNGLMDTDGHVTKLGGQSFTSTSLDLAEAVTYLVRSVGGIARMTNRVTTYIYNGEKRKGRRAYTVHIRHPHPNSLFRLPRKKDRCKATTQYTDAFRLQLTNIEYVGEEETQCISINHPDRLYVTDSFTVTHNTFLGIHSASKFGVRTALVAASGHFPTWINAFKDFTTLDVSKEVCTVQGQKQLGTVVDLAKSGENPYKVMLISISTLRNYLKMYLEEGITIDDLSPYDLFPTLGIGLRIVDESHENIHALITSTIHTHVKRTIYLSATLVSEDEAINKQYVRIFPPEDRFLKVKDNDHCIAVGFNYGIREHKKLKYQGGKGYSHVKFEQSIMKDKALEKGYYQMIYELANSAFFSRKKDGQKLLIFCATTEMCDKLAAYIKKALGEKNTLSVSAYTADHAESILYETDVIVSTPSSAGTGKDIPDLAVGISTVAIGSVQRNLQMLGRLRPLKRWPEQDPVYIWLTCTNIRQHNTYSFKKHEQFKGKVKDMRKINSNYNL